MNKILLSDLKRYLGRAHVAIGADIGDRYRCDWGGVKPCQPLAVLRPKTTSDVAYIMKQCYEAAQRVVIQGGMTGLCSGASPQPGEFAVSLERMRGVEEIDVDAMTLTALSGTPLQEVQMHAAKHSLLFPLDLGARGSCTIGGNIATNAGGTEVIQFGMARALVLGLEAVLPNGTVISSLNKMLKNNAGFDVKQLFIGTEGTLGIITRAVLRVFPAPAFRLTALCAVECLSKCLALLRQIRIELTHNLRSFEVMWPDYIDYIRKTFPDVRLPLDFDDRLFVLIEATGSQEDGDTQAFESALHRAMGSALIDDAVIAQSHDDAAGIWRVRESIAEVFQHLSHAISFDISAPVGSIGALLDDITESLDNAFADYTKLTYGHLGDSNIHLTISAGRKEHFDEVSDIVYGHVQGANGSISGEHGIGTTKRKYLSISRTPEEIALMRSLKKAIDPKNILNAERVIPAFSPSD